MDFEKILNFLNGRIHYSIAALCVFCLWYWYKPNPYTEFAIVVLTVFVFGGIVKWGIERIRRFWYIRGRKKRPKSLTVSEKEVLGQYIERQERAIALYIVEPVVANLICEKILVRTSNLSLPGGMPAAFSVSIQPFVWDYLNKHRDLLE
jgi:hypothetical protein